MWDLEIYIGFTGTVAALFSAFVLLSSPTGARRSRIWMALLLILLSSYGIGCHLTDMGGFERYPHLQQVGSTLSMAFMPLLYLYAKERVDPGRRFRAADLLHALPFVMQTLIRLPFFARTAAEKLRDPVPQWEGGLNRLSLLAMAIGYAIAMIAMHRRHEAALPEQESRLEGRHLTWLLLLTFGWGLVYAINAWEIFLGPVPPLSSGVLAGLLTFTTGYLALTKAGALAFSPSKYRKNIDSASINEAQSGEADPVPTEPDQAEPAPSKSGLLSLEREQEILARVQDFMATERPYLEPDLNLADLAGRLRLPPTYVSRALNNQLGQNFYTFINEHRVEAAKRRLQEDAHRNVLEVALATGFGSKSTFNSVFKKFTGLTPSEFRKTGTTERAEQLL